MGYFLFFMIFFIAFYYICFFFALFVLISSYIIRVRFLEILILRENDNLKYFLEFQGS
jgi:hypothetical protein